jgi:hypothetical protein
VDFIVVRRGGNGDHDRSSLKASQYGTLSLILGKELAIILLLNTLPMYLQYYYTFFFFFFPCSPFSSPHHWNFSGHRKRSNVGPDSRKEAQIPPGGPTRRLATQEGSKAIKVVYNRGGGKNK